jgi:hypothetical protein
MCFLEMLFEKILRVRDEFRSYLLDRESIYKVANNILRGGGAAIISSRVNNEFYTE